MLSLSLSSLSFAPVAPVRAPAAARTAAPIMQTKEELAVALNPAIGYCAPRHQLTPIRAARTSTQIQAVA